MPYYKVSFSDGQHLFVNAPNPAAAEAHVNEPTGLVRNPQLGKAGFETLPNRPRIDMRATVTGVEALDKFQYRRLQQLEAQDEARRAELAELTTPRPRE